MNRQGVTVYLKASPEVLYAHLKMGKTVRPLLLNKTEEEVKRFIIEQVSEREKYYLKAKNILDVNILSTFAQTKVAVANLRALLGI